jgi:hypothetical protein
VPVIILMPVAYRVYAITGVDDVERLVRLSQAGIQVVHLECDIWSGYVWEHRDHVEADKMRMWKFGSYFLDPVFTVSPIRIQPVEDSDIPCSFLSTYVKDAGIGYAQHNFLKRPKVIGPDEQLE